MRFFLTLKRETSRNQVTQKQKSTSPEPGVPHHLMDRRDVASSPRNWPSLQQGQRQRPGQAARQNCAPTCDQRGSDPALQDLWRFLCPSLRHGIEEIRCFLGSATSHFSRQNHQTGLLPHLRVRGMWFPSPCELPAKPHRSWWLRAVVQCRRHADTRVVLTANCAPCQRDNTSTMTSMRRP